VFVLAVGPGGGAPGGGCGGGGGPALPSGTPPPPPPPPGVWGEHEIDYVLLARLPGPGSDLPLAPNPEEVSDTVWVDRAGLLGMMDASSGLTWSPWFRIIARTWLVPAWWADLEGAIGGDGHVDAGTVHRIDC